MKKFFEYIFRIVYITFVGVIFTLIVIWGFVFTLYLILFSRVMMGDRPFAEHAVSRVELVGATCFIALVIIIMSSKGIDNLLNFRNDSEKKSDE